MRQEHNRAFTSRGKPAGVYEVIFRKWRSHGGGETQKICVRAPDFFLQRRIGHSACAENFDLTPLQAKIAWLDVGEKFIARPYNSPVVIAQIAFAVFGNVSGRIAVAAGPV